MLKKLSVLGLSALLVSACAAVDDTTGSGTPARSAGSKDSKDARDSADAAETVDAEDSGEAAEVDDQTRAAATGTRNDALGRTCYCTGAAACGHSSSPSYMFSAAHAAMLAAGVTDASLTQTYGDAPASVGTQDRKSTRLNSSH